MIWTVFGLLLLAYANGQEICLSGEEDPYLLFGTKTSYIFANKIYPTTRIQDIPGCQPIAIWLLSRHGSHNPEANETAGLQSLTDLRNNILTNYRNGNFRNTDQRICSSDLNLLERWSWSPGDPMLAGDLTSEGYISTQQLAQAWKNKYPGLLTDNPHDYLFKFGDDLRSSTSFRAFTEGLFKSQSGGNDVPKENDEKILRPYKFCNTWMNEVGDNNDTLVQKGTFESKQEYREMISNISKRLGFNYDVHRDVINSMYQMCRYDKAWNVAQISPWCAVFTKEDLKRIEYAEDLETYYKYGYGNSLNEKMGCTTLKDMMDFLKNHVEHDTPQQPRVQIQFTEAATIMLTATAMGTRRDTTPLTGDNYHTPAVPTRQWTTSLMSPFSANIAAVLYKCTQDGNFQVKGEYQVLFLENEKPMKIEGCRVGLCDWNFVKNKFNEMTDSCDLQFCNNASYIKGYASIVLIVTFFATILNS
ncbi:multiple inositol polyphosphate phosphatase 1 [Papilio machaon]|uniref:multiple inositol polyphosphate phosphatase 1 n=1 Tax=Papilio machaon TaxID=76193 RepID=UPI001E666173|nr:multiple inositol polyphosphate phosphatase 1 [Papilio machaon]